MESSPIYISFTKEKTFKISQKHHSIHAYSLHEDGMNPKRVVNTILFSFIEIVLIALKMRQMLVV